jgi:hypothetical protein
VRIVPALDVVEQRPARRAAIDEPVAHEQSDITGRLFNTCPQREAINKALAAGYSYRDVAGLYAVSKTALHRHWQGHVAAEAAGASVAAVRVTGTPRTTFGKWIWWAAGILAGLWLVGRAGTPGD